MSIVRENLMTEPGYTPYCGANKCRFHWPRMQFNGEQFKCGCGFKTKFPPDFIADYKAKWALAEPSNNQTKENGEA